MKPPLPPHRDTAGHTLGSLILVAAALALTALLLAFGIVALTPLRLTTSYMLVLAGFFALHVGSTMVTAVTVAAQAGVDRRAVN